MRIAIVGAGISGLATAHLLHGEHDVTVFEAGEHAGGHANTVRVDTEDATHHVDTGFIVFNDRNYPYFERLLERLKVSAQPSNMSFGVSDGGDFEYTGSSANGLFAKRAHLVTPWFHRMVFDLVKFNRNARTLLATGGEGPSLGHWLEEGDYSKPFVERLIVPQASAVWSADPRQMWTFPARFLVEFFDNHGMLGFAKRPQWRTVVGGSRSYVDAITAPLTMRLATPVTAITRDEDGVTVTPRGGEPERFDEVVIATHSDQALHMLGDDATDREHEILGAIPYQPNEAVLHTDTRLLPRRKRAWASWNYHLLPEPTGMTTVTYHMNRLQALTADREFCVTLNRSNAIDPGKVLRTFSYAHPVFTAAGARAQARHHEISGVNRTHYAGAYWRWGFHEDGVVSGARVAEHFGARL
ncbi:FAD-dependent oxidoreductase [Solirubrobacter phytolaccae]|uniref:FAD-dependent oxidoreductase n=1 Tax=Solirubrobacter phytolaccae TaxID=1404360 RepID=A0A9X3S901_9ACTN|nr:FAD-dependent oxidoreductase [Solirubrobacter phytolaccae]MDA0182824.1 FAD-dependent oxidoreductase [Solirubrobacter phytolaccae]